jgi:hypothetical protein
MPDSKHPGRNQTPSAKVSFPAAGSRGSGIKFFGPTLSTIGIWSINQVTKSKRGPFDFSANQIGRTNPPIIRQILLLFGEGDEASSAGEGDFSRS